MTDGYEGSQGDTRGYKGLQGETGGYKGRQGVKRGNKGIQKVTKRSKRLHQVKTDDSWLQRVTGRLQRVTEGCKGLQQTFSLLERSQIIYHYLILHKNNSKKKISNFNQNNGLTPLEKLHLSVFHKKLLLKALKASFFI